MAEAPRAGGVAVRILQIHTSYRNGGGEDRVVENERQLLLDAGHEVHAHRALNSSTAVGRVHPAVTGAVEPRRGQARRGRDR